MPTCPATTNPAPQDIPRPETPDRATFCRLYYREKRCYDDITAALGFSRAFLDAWRQDSGLPSRRWLRPLPAPAPDPAAVDPPAAPDGQSTPQRQTFVRRRAGLPATRLQAACVRVLGRESYWELR